LFVELAVAAACLFRAELFAGRLFPDRPLQLAALSREDLLVVGVALLGVSSVAAAAPGVIRFAGKMLWFAQGSRQAQFLASMAGSWEELAKSVLELFVGAALAAKAGRLGSALDRAYRNSGGHEGADEA
jgi:hypothetical protein